MSNQGVLEAVQETIVGKFENKRANPKCDFHYKGQPLLRDHDIIDANDETVDSWPSSPHS